MKTIKIISLNLSVEKVCSLAGKIKGFMFSIRRKEGKLFAFGKEQKVGIHMLFVFFPLIVAWLDNQKRIREIKVMRPFLSFHEEKAKYVLEIPYDNRVLGKLRRASKLDF